MWSLFAFSLVAPPPLGAFPAEIFPKDGTTAPQNFVVVATGATAPAPEQLSVIATQGQQPLALADAVAMGPSVIVVSPLGEPAAVGDIRIDVGTGDDARSATFAIGATDDVAPTFVEPPTLVSHAKNEDGVTDQVVLAMEAADNTTAAYWTASIDDVVVASSAVGFLLVANVAHITEQTCMNVVVYDVANNPSSTEVVCADTLDDPFDDSKDPDDARPASCASSGAGFALALGSLLRRRRQLWPRSHRQR